MNDHNLDVELTDKINLKTKPLGSLGVLEEVAHKLGKIQKTLNPKMNNPHILVFAGDHGLSQAGVSPYPSEVTRQMVLNFVEGGAFINVVCRQHDICLKVVDCGVLGSEPFPDSVLSKKVAPSTKNTLHEDAMTKAQLEQCLENGKQLVEDLSKDEVNTIGFGEMGIGNTSSASLITSYLLKLPIEKVTGAGAGLDSEGLKRKIETLSKVYDNRLGKNTTYTPLEALQKVGGFEMATMVGAYLEAFRQNSAILVDGFISSACFLVASRVEPNIVQNAFICHASQSVGHQYICKHLDLKPVIDLNLRLGEGSGIGIAFPLLKSAELFLSEMASFQEAGVSQKDK